MPTARLENLRRRATLLADIRAFFSAHNVFEVETPVLSAAAATDLHLDSFVTEYTGPGAPARLYLHTSPEFPMKRLLAAGSGPIFQVCKVFRNGEAGRLHNPEFTMLEWYRPGFGYDQLMDEVAALVGAVLSDRPAAQKVTYAEAFGEILEIDPHRAKVSELAAIARSRGLEASGMADAGVDAWRDLLLTHFIEPALGRDAPTFLYDYPASQAALARIRDGDPPVAERFELYIDGVEIANGYQELNDPQEQARRFTADRRRRAAAGLPDVELDKRLVDALSHGLPNCAGVALGVDRLCMVLIGADSVDQVLAFPVSRA